MPSSKLYLTSRQSRILGLGGLHDKYIVAESGQKVCFMNKPVVNQEATGKVFCQRSETKERYQGHAQFVHQQQFPEMGRRMK